MKIVWITYLAILAALIAVAPDWIGTVLAAAFVSGYLVADRILTARFARITTDEVMRERGWWVSVVVTRRPTLNWDYLARMVVLHGWDTEAWDAEDES